MAKLAAAIDQLRALGVALPPGRLFLDAYGDSLVMSQQLIGLIQSGRKRAGACLLWSLQADGEAAPAVGDVAVVVDHLGRPVLLTPTTAVAVVPFCEVTAEFAAKEGEGDLSLEYWRRGHWAFFSRECAAIGREPSDQMPVVCVEFEVAWHRVLVVQKESIWAASPTAISAKAHRAGVPPSDFDSESTSAPKPTRAAHSLPEGRAAECTYSGHR